MKVMEVYAAYRSVATARIVYLKKVVPRGLVQDTLPLAPPMIASIPGKPPMTTEFCMR